MATEPQEWPEWPSGERRTIARLAAMRLASAAARGRVLTAARVDRAEPPSAFIAAHAAAEAAATQEMHDSVSGGADARAHPHAAHAEALRAAGATPKRINEVLQLGAACAAADDVSAKVRMAQAAAVTEAHDALSNSGALGDVPTAHGAGVCANARIVLPKHTMSLPLKKLGLYGFAVVFDGAATDWDSALECPGGLTGTLLGSGALLNAGCKRCGNVRISKVEWCAVLQAFKVSFALKRTVKRGTELLLHYGVRHARCKCRCSLHF